MEKENKSLAIPTSEQLKKELAREKRKPKGSKLFINFIFAFIVVAAIFTILTTLFFPVMGIRGGSMSPTLEDGSITVALKTDDLQRGDICVFYSGSNILCKRVIAFGGEIVNIDENGVVYVDNVPLNEHYLTATDLGNTNIRFPYLVPENTYFVMGDNRSESMDSRNTKIGCISEGQMIGKVIFRFWPFDEIGTIE